MTSKVTRFLSLWLPLIVYMGTLSIFSLLPARSWHASISDKLMHFGEFSLLCLLFIRALGGGLLQPLSLSVYCFGAIFSFAYGLLNEVQQTFVPYRYFDVLDLLSNAGGIVIGAASVFILHRFLGSPTAFDPSTSPQPASDEDR